MTYWNMRAYSDGGKMRSKASRAETGGPTQAQWGRGGFIEGGDPTAMRAHASRVVGLSLRGGR